VTESAVVGEGAGIGVVSAGGTEVGKSGVTLDAGGSVRALGDGDSGTSVGGANVGASLGA
jgi:hypothetical protein